MGRGGQEGREWVLPVRPEGQVSRWPLRGEACFKHIRKPSEGLSVAPLCFPTTPPGVAGRGLCCQDFMKEAS